MGESRMLIDGKLVGAEDGTTFDNINPATEEILGPVANGSPGDMERAISAARRAFDNTDWGTNGEFRKKRVRHLAVDGKPCVVLEPAHGPPRFRAFDAVERARLVAKIDKHPLRRQHDLA